jgi:hypothetical protein
MKMLCKFLDLRSTDIEFRVVFVIWDSIKLQKVVLERNILWITLSILGQLWSKILQVI